MKRRVETRMRVMRNEGMRKDRTACKGILPSSPVEENNMVPVSSAQPF